jgi:eukaryotic-like serine/threonine-protein kinase
MPGSARAFRPGRGCIQAPMIRTLHPHSPAPHTDDSASAPDGDDFAATVVLQRAALSGDSSLPKTIGKYRVISRLGEGATSEVFLAHDDFRKTDVAIKRLRYGHGDDVDDGHFHTRFFAAEADLVGQLQHPNVVRLLDAGVDGAAPYVVMEYVPGQTLARFCRPDALLTLETIVEVAFKCAMALGYCWKQGLIHRDVKPANILVVMRGLDVQDVKITDFGSVMNLASDRTQVLRVGSLNYMAPEQVDGDELDCRTDMYALGAVMYHLIAGRPPFEAASQPALLKQIFHSSPPPLTQLRADVAPALDQLVRQAMARRREDRPASWDDFAASLSQLISRHEVPRKAEQAVLDSERFNMLRALPFFSNFGDVALWEVVHRATWTRFATGSTLFRKGETGQRFHIVAEGRVEVFRDGQCVARVSAGRSVGEMAYLAPNPELRAHRADAWVREPTATVSFTPESLGQLSLETRSLFDAAFIRVLVRRLHAAQETLIGQQLAEQMAVSLAEAE